MDRGPSISFSKNNDWEIIEPEHSNQNVRSMFSQDNKPKSAPIKGEIIEDAAQKKFGSAKGISSAQYFNEEPSQFERNANLTRFQGSSSISSADYFSDGTNTSTKRSNSSYSTGSNTQFQTPDMDDVKESVRQGVTKVAGKLSSLANGVMTSLQDKYGY